MVGAMTGITEKAGKFQHPNVSFIQKCRPYGAHLLYTINLLLLLFASRGPLNKLCQLVNFVMMRETDIGRTALPFWGGRERLEVNDERNLIHPNPIGARLLF